MSTKFLPILLLCILCGCSLRAADTAAVAKDDASDPAYSSGWKPAGGGSGFGDWIFQTLMQTGSQSYAGFYIADGDGPGKTAIAGKSFGLYANGVAFEVASAFRPFKAPLVPGQTFSYSMKSGEFVKKFDQDGPGSWGIGITLRTGNANAAVDDYNKGARVEFGAYEGKPNYQIYDGESNQDSGIAVSDEGVSVSITVLTPDTYDLSVMTLADGKTTTLKGRKMGGTPGAPIESFCIFDRNGEKNDVFFNGFQVAGQGGAVKSASPAETGK